MGPEPERPPLGDLSGRTVLVTGGSSGLGFFAADALLAAGAEVVITSRSESRARDALAALRARTPAPHVSSVLLDTADRSSVRAAASRLAELPRLDAVLANAGRTEAPRTRITSVDGTELVLATNVLGHLTLLGALLPRLEPDGRVVMVGSLATRLHDVRVDDLQLRSRYGPFRAYAQSKILAEIVGFELQRRLAAAGSSRTALVAHPGFALDGLTQHVPEIARVSAGTRLAERPLRLVAQGKDAGAAPLARAVADPSLPGGSYVGPAHRTTGAPVLATPAPQCVDPEIAAAVWPRLAELADTSIPVA